MNAQYLECGGGVHYRQSSHGEGCTPSRQHRYRKLDLQMSISVRGATCERKHTIGHAHAQIVDGFPVRKGFNNGVLATISVVMVILQVVPNEEFIIALCAQEQAKAEIMGNTPDQRMHKLEGERISERVGQNGECHPIQDDQNKHRVSGSVIARKDRK